MHLLFFATQFANSNINVCIDNNIPAVINCEISECSFKHWNIIFVYSLITAVICAYKSNNVSAL